MIKTEKISISLQRDTAKEIRKFQIQFGKRSFSDAIEGLAKESLINYSKLDQYNKKKK